MKKHEVIETIKNYTGNTCLDQIVYGDTASLCTGVILTAHASIGVIKQAIKIGANLIITHEPSFYTCNDRLEWLNENEVFLYKKKLLDDNNITIWRHNVSGGPAYNYFGAAKTLGWENYTTDYRTYTIPETTVKELTEFLVDKLNLNGARYVGNPGAKVRNIYLGDNIGGGVDEQIPINRMRENIDVLIPLESWDWTTPAYVLDASQLGYNKAIIGLGAYNVREAGVKYLSTIYPDLFNGDLTIEFVQSGADMYEFIENVRIDEWKPEIKKANTEKIPTGDMAGKTNSEIILSIRKYHSPDLTISVECDKIIYGGEYADDECKGVVTTMHPTIEVIKETIKLGYNLIVVHEPTFYNSWDSADLYAADEIVIAKKKLLDDNRIVIWRNHDHLHQNRNDPYTGEPTYCDHTFWGAAMSLGWAEYKTNYDSYPNGINPYKVYELPEMKIGDMAKYIVDKMNLKGGRVIGSLDGTATITVLGTHILAEGGDSEYCVTNFFIEPGINVIVPNEIQDNLALSYCLDAKQMGKNHAVLNYAHYNMEEFGMQYMAVCFSERIWGGNMPVAYVQSGDMYNYLVKL